MPFTRDNPVQVMAVQPAYRSDEGDVLERWTVLWIMRGGIVRAYPCQWDHGFRLAKALAARYGLICEWWNPTCLMYQQG